MKTYKLFLISGVSLLVVAILIGVYVWYSLQQLNVQTEGYKEALQQESNNKNKIQGITIEEVDSIPEGADVIEINTADLSDAQRKTLDVLGFEEDSFVITETMIVCAKDSIGPDRYEQILSGASPTPFESIKLLACMK